jgi:hypothetical protein
MHGTTHDHRNTERKRHPEVLRISGLYFGLSIKSLHTFRTITSAYEHQKRAFAALITPE